jgi:hypothetical protein
MGNGISHAQQVAASRGQVLERQKRCLAGRQAGSVGSGARE